MSTTQYSLADKVQQWIDRDPDPATRAELKQLLESGQHEELTSLFAGRLQFGTAGIRGIVGPGPMRMNRLVIQETSAGLASYVLDNIAAATKRGIVVAFDARPDSRQFAEDAASVFVAAGLPVYLTSDAQPTPIGAFAVREYDAAAAVVITASHNPPEYNGYKVYWENGAQIIPPHDTAIAECIDQAASSPLPQLDLAAARESGLVADIGDDFVARYRATVLSNIQRWQVPNSPRIAIAYTALHGVGASIAQSLVEESGLADFFSVTSQHHPDGTFPTVAFPNPEESGAMDAVIDLARSNDCLLACANDPDADRLAVAVRQASGEYSMLSGDQIGILLGHYCLRKVEAAHQIVCASMVSSRMLGRIANASGAKYFETLTGFKWLSNIALENESDTHKFLFAYEEALGYALGQLVRDKDGLSALLLFVQMASELAADGRTVFDQLESLYREHGLFLTEQISIRTQDGQQSITQRLRTSLPNRIAGIEVESTKDLLSGRHIYRDGHEEALRTPSNDVVVFYLTDDSRVIVRPSGTEPKTKCYYEVAREFSASDSFAEARTATEQQLADLVGAHQKEIAALKA